MYRTKALRLRQFFVQPNWTGGIYASPTFAGNRFFAILRGSKTYVKIKLQINPNLYFV